MEDIEKLHKELERLKNEEFVAALLGANLEAARKVGESLREEIEKKEILIDGKTVKVTISLGVSGYSTEKTLDEIINKADKAMYEAKRQGKNRVMIAINGE